MLIFGVSFRYESNEKKIEKSLEETVKKMSSLYSESWDPDCLWRPLKQKTCSQVKDPKQTESIETFAKLMKQETSGYFDVEFKDKDGKRKRDFGGISQGFFIEELAQQIKGQWVADFAGDIYFTGGFVPKKLFFISEPLDERLNYAKVSMKSGWMMSSAGKGLNVKIRNPIKQKSQEDFQKIVLFGKKEMSGARLDAWTTALIAGGKELLEKLWALEGYKGQWAYLYFDRKGSVSCSSNVTCLLDQSVAQREIRLSW